MLASYIAFNSFMLQSTILFNASHVLCLQTITCYNGYSKHFNLNYHRSQPVTHALLRQFYNGFLLHDKFIELKLLVRPIRRHLRSQLNMIKTELGHNIARLHQVVSKTVDLFVSYRCYTFCYK